MLKRVLISILPALVSVSCAQQSTALPEVTMAATNVVQTSTIPRTPAPKVYSKRAIVVDYATGKVLYAKNATERCHIASLQKMLTALCIMDRGNIDRKLTVKSYDTKVVPSKIYIKPGQKYSRRTLLKALLVKSGNDAARALARDASGNETKFAAVMNRKAKSIGMRYSRFQNPHGLTASNQYSTAYDAAILARQAYHNKTLRAYMSTKSYTFKYANGKTRLFRNTNRVLRELSYCNGLKTGTTNAAGRCLASSGTLNGRTAIVVCLGGNSKCIWNDSKALLKWALERPAGSQQ